VVGAVWARLFGPTGRFAARHVEWQPRRSALTVATIGLGLGAVLLFSVLGWSLERTLLARLSDRIKSDLIVSSGLMLSGYREAPLAESVVSGVANLPGVQSAVGEQEIEALLESGEPVVVNAYDDGCFIGYAVCDWKLSDGASSELPNLLRGDAVLVSDSFARTRGTQEGDWIRLQSPGGVRAYRVAGVTRGLNLESVIMSRRHYKEVWTDRLIYLLHVDVVADADVEVVRGNIAKTLGEHHKILIRSREDLLDYFGQQAREAFSLSYLLQGMTFLLLTVAIGDTLAAGVNERTRRFATLRALGMSKGSVFQLVMLEGATIGVLGLALAITVGAALGLFWVSIQFPALLGWRLDVHVPYLFALGAGLLTLLLCLIGSLLPSRRVARLVVAEALRGD
jgi:putative ABC transport system permease protein